MLSHNSPEFGLLPLVKQFRDDYFPACLAILHPSVFFDDDTFNPGDLDELEARRQLKTNPKTDSICEITPDYGLFKKSDVVGIRLRAGNQSGRDVFIAPDSNDFGALVESANPIPYMAYDSRTPIVPKGKRMVVLLKDGTRPAAIIDHKGGRTYNLQGERIKVLYQAKRFAAAEAYILTEKPMPAPMVAGGQISVKRVKRYECGTIWRLIDGR